MQAIVIPMEDELLHTDSTPFCDDPWCPCRVELLEAWDEVWQAWLTVPSYVSRDLSKEAI